VKDLSRREALELLTAVPFVGALGLSPAAAQRGARFVRELFAAPEQAYAPKFFTAHEWQAVRVLVDLVIPKDDRSGSATDAKVPEFMDFILDAYPDKQLWMRGGLAWLDTECFRRGGKTFLESDEMQRRAVLDLIAWPDKAPADLHQGVAFFNRFRDLTASGFWSSQMGVGDIQYKGNVFVMDWQGCPPAQLAKLGVSYD
jgi:Gluconate 2-dehydrogenase subunit 3